MALFTWLQRLSRGIATHNKSGGTWFRRSRSSGYRPSLEVLEARLAPATNITILASGVGSLDHFLSATNGTITTAEDSGDTGATLSKTALQGVGAGVPINIAADNAIIFQDLGTLNLKTGHGVSATFTTTTGAISFNQTTNTVLTMGGALIFTAGTDLTASNLNTSGGNVFLTAGTNGAGNLQFRNVVAGATGHVALQATNAAGGGIFQAGVSSTATGLAINGTATGDIVVNSLFGTVVTLTSNTGSITSSGSQAVRASSQLTINAATGITLNILAVRLSASNSTSGNVYITQVAAALQALTINGSGLVNHASGGSVTVSNSGAGIAVGGAGVLSNNGTVTLAATDLQIGAPVTSDTARTILESSHFGGHIDLGTNTLGTVGLTQAELNKVTAAVLQIGSATAGTINVSAAISSAIGWNTLTLVNNGPITEAPTGSLHVPNLRVSSGGAVALVGINHVGVLAADTAKAFSLDNGTNPLSVGVVDGDLGILTNGSAIHLIADALDIMQPVTTGSSSTGVVTLEPFTKNRTIDLGTNTGGTLGLTGTELNEITAGVLRIGSNGITGNITITNAISDLAAGWSTLSLICGGSISESGGSLAVTNLAVQGGGSVDRPGQHPDAGGVQLLDLVLIQKLVTGAIDLSTGIPCQTHRLHRRRCRYQHGCRQARFQCANQPHRTMIKTAHHGAIHHVRLLEIVDQLPFQ